MLKRIFSAVLLTALFTTTLLAAPAFPGKRTVTQPDGTTVTVQMVGDEHFHTMVTANDRLPLGRTDDGSLNYRLADGTLSTIAAHNPGERTATEAEFLKQNIDNLSLSKLAATIRQNKPSRFANRHKPVSSPAQDSRAGATKAPLAATFTDCPTTGNRKIPVIFVQYTDVSFKSADPKETFKTYFTEGDQSGRQYFYDQSNGVYDPQFDLYGPITLSRERKYYGGNGFDGTDTRPGEMVAEACKLLDGQINFKDYDTNSDGFVDAVIILFAGNGEHYSDGESLVNTIWPHQWDLASSDYGRTLTLDGVKINTYGCFNELYGMSPNTTKIDGIGVFCHEFSHVLGLPDLYGTSIDSAYYYGMGSWSLMCQGCYNNDGYNPVSYNAYEKWFMGWIDIPEATENTHYTLPVFNSKNAANDQAVKITNPSNSNEYWIFENRGLLGWDSYNPAEGLLIYRVSYDYYTWFYNQVNNTNPGRLWPMCADNSAAYYDIKGNYDEIGDLWPYGDNNAFTSTSSPAMLPYNGIIAVDRPVTDITRNSDGTISFWAMKADVPALEAPVLAAHTDVTSTGFTANWSHSANIGLTYTLEVFPHSDYALVFDQNFSNGVGQWTKSGYTILESGANAYRLGSTNQLGALTSPEFTLDNSGKVTVIYSAKYYNNDNSPIQVSLVSTGGDVIASKNQTLTSTFSTYSTILEGDPGASVKVKLGSTAKSKRVHLASTKVYTGDATAQLAPAKAPVETNNNGKRIITGITGLSYTVENLTANEQYDYRVKAVPTDPTEASESAWSATASVTLTQSGIDAIDTDSPDANAPVRWYNIHGIEVTGLDLTPGIYIRRQGNTSEKIVVR